MSKFDLFVWKRFAGDILLIAPYILAPVCLVGCAEWSKSDDPEARFIAAICFWASIAFHIVSHLISAGLIR